MESTITSDGGRGRDPDVIAVNGRVASTDRTDSESISEDDIFEVLYNRRRRQVITYLQECGGTATASELAEHIAAEENGVNVAQLSSSERKRVYVSLYQNHLPVMDDANVIEYDPNRKRVELLETVTHIEPYLAEPTEQTDSRLSIAAAVATAMFVVLGILQIGAFAVTSAAAWSVLGSVGLVGAAVLERY